MLSVIKRIPHSTTTQSKQTMPENTESNQEPANRQTPTPATTTDCAGTNESVANKNNNNSGSEQGGFSPHSTTASPGNSGHQQQQQQQRKTRPASSAAAADVEQQASRRSSPSDTEQFGPLKQVLATVHRLAASVSKQHADRVQQIVTDLLIGSIETDEFQQRVLDVLRLPFRPLVPALLEQQLTPVRKEMAARLHSMRHQHSSSGGSDTVQQQTGMIAKEVRSLIGIDGASDALPVLSYWQVFEPDSGSIADTDADSSPNGTTSRKRRASASLTETENAHQEPGNKKHHHVWRSESTTTSSLWIPPRVYQQQSQQSSPPSLGQHHHHHHHQQPVVTTKSASPPFRVQQHQGDEEWANIHTMLNCILSMVEKTRRALGILQQRANESQSQYSQYKRRDAHLTSPPHYHANGHHHQVTYEASELRRHAGELIAQTLKATEDRVTQVKRKAEEAVQDVRRAAMAELQRALSAERVRAERLAAEAKRQGAEEALLALGRLHQSQAANKEACWNCGRRASETCSGCNVARYCSTFCQHKHWELHHKICGRTSQLLLASPLAADAQSGDRVASPAPSQQPRTSPKPTSPVQAAGQTFVH